MAFIKLTYMDGTAKKDVYVSVEQIVRIGDPTDTKTVYKSGLLLANGQQNVLESVEEVMGLIQVSGRGA